MKEVRQRAVEERAARDCGPKSDSSGRQELSTRRQEAQGKDGDTNVHSLVE